MADVRRLLTPPHSIEAEQAVLGSLLISKTAFARISHKLGAADFYRPDHRTIYAAIAALHSEGKAVDSVTVSDHLERQGTLAETGGLAYIARVARDTPSAANVETYAATVRERSSLRRLQAIGDNLVKAAASPTEQTAAELVAAAQDELQRLQSRARTGSGLIGAKQLIHNLCDDLDRRSAGSIGLELGLPDFDALTRGLEPGDLVVIAARPGMGKTALLVSVAGVASQTVNVAAFSAEMPAQQLMRRCVSLQSKVSQGLLRRPENLSKDDWSKIYEAAGVVAQRQLWVDDTAAPSLAHIRAETVALHAHARLGLVLVDYVQLVRGLGANRYEQLRDVAYGLKALAKELGVPIVVLAQLNRGVEAREHKRPQISDLRDSGAIEEAADIVALLYSEEYYNPGFEMPHVLECHVAKNRNGERGECFWRFDGAFSQVTPLNSSAAAQYHRILSKSRKTTSDDL